MKYKLYVWEGVFCDWSCGIAVAIAKTKPQAIKQLKDKGISDCSVRELQSIEPDVYSLDKPNAFYTYGGS